MAALLALLCSCTGDNNGGSGPVVDLSATPHNERPDASSMPASDLPLFTDRGTAADGASVRDGSADVPSPADLASVRDGSADVPSPADLASVRDGSADVPSPADLASERDGSADVPSPVDRTAAHDTMSGGRDQGTAPSPDLCVPQCAGRECGSDGCGGSCGSCTTPPAPQCVGSETLLTFTSPGTCAAGSCSYSSSNTTCCCDNGACLTAPAPTLQGAAVQSIGEVGLYSSQYSPWVMYQPGWGSYVMYYCKNTSINGVHRDRVWRTESWTGGINDWINDQVVIEGTMNQDDDLSCSPGAVIDAAGTWHMYYVAADRNSAMTLYLYHATAPAPGVTWTKQGKVGGAFPQPAVGYLETPSPLLINNTIVLYFVGQNGKLHRTTSQGGHSFTAPVQLNSPGWASHGRVTYAGGSYHYVYSEHSAGCCDPPDRLLYATSQDGLCFTPGQLIAQASGTSFDGTRLWSPHALISSKQLRVYYAGNQSSGTCSPACSGADACIQGTCTWWGSNTSIGIRSYLLP